MDYDYTGTDTYDNISNIVSNQEDLNSVRNMKVNSGEYENTGEIPNGIKAGSILVTEYDNKTKNFIPSKVNGTNNYSGSTKREDESSTSSNGSEYEDKNIMPNVEKHSVHEIY